MSASTLLDRLAPDGPTDVRAERGRAWLLAHGFPGSDDEAWRYAPVDALVEVLEGHDAAPVPSTELDTRVVDELAGDHGGGVRVVTVNGVLVPRLSRFDELPAGVWVGGSDALAPRRRPGSPAPVDEPADAFHALNWAAGRDVVAVLVDAGVEVELPVHVVHLTVPRGGAALAHPRTVVRLGAGARAQLIETYAGVGSSTALTNASSRLGVGVDAALEHHRVVEGPSTTLHVGRTAIDAGLRSTARTTGLVLGGAIVRCATHAHLAGDDARAELLGLFRPVGDERHDVSATVEHSADRGASRQRYKGIAADRARGSFSGRIVVRHGTSGTDARQSNPNLLLGPHAEVDTRPWLEILADDVRCSHGTTVGRLDEDAAFYLRSRGIPDSAARDMLVAAFAAEITDAIRPPSLRALVERAIASGDPGGAA